MLLLGSAATAAASGLVDHPIVADSVTYLDGADWMTAATLPGPDAGVRGTEQMWSIPASVPGDLLTDLEAAGLIGDPLYELNWLNSSIWDNCAP